MTGDERVAMIRGTASLFVENVPKTCLGLTNEEMMAKMLGTIAGAIAVMEASGLPPGNIYDGIIELMGEMLL